MARPRTIKLADGEISLHGFSKENADALSAHIESFGKPSPVVAAPAEAALAVAAPTPEAPAVYTGKAIGISHVGNDRHLVTVSYDLATKQAVIDSAEPAQGQRDAAIKFKMAASKHRFV